MKKSMFLIIIFITMFFVGKNSVLANCGDKKGYANMCKYVNYETAERIYLYYNETETMITEGEGNTYREYLNKNGTAEEVPGYDYNPDTGKKTNYNYTLHFYNDIASSKINQSCPLQIYYTMWSKFKFGGNHHYYHYYLEYVDDPKLVESYRVYELANDCNDNNEKPPIEKPKEENCDDLIDEDIRKYINDIMMYLRIGIPILLVGLIIYDLATAIFAGADDKVNKTKERTIKRIIIAIVIFFVPTLINFVFDIVNDIWSKNYEICGLETNN